MKEEIDDIGNIFKTKLQKQQLPIENEEWDNVQLKLAKVRFLNFSVSNFNIYYSILIVGCFVFSSAAFIKSFFYTNPQVPVKEEKINFTSVNDSINTYDSSGITSNSESFNLNQRSNKKSTNKERGNTSLEDKETSIERNGKIPESISTKDTMPADSVSIQTTPKILKKKKVVQVIKQDTIVIDETPSKKKINRRK